MGEEKVLNYTEPKVILMSVTAKPEETIAKAARVMLQL